jgi:hypothetical protein
MVLGRQAEQTRQGASLPLKEDGEIIRHSLVAADETTHRAASVQLQYLATHDHLTEVLSRSVFELKVEAAIRQQPDARSSFWT